jgi:HD-GYP domain-containing protein (c-di-GMP phosphodiesterase class II)
MKKIPLTSLKPGMVFSKPVYVDEDNMLVPADIAIREKDLRQLGSWGIKIVETDGVLVSPKPAPDPPAPPGEPAALPAASQAVPGRAEESITVIYTDLIKQMDLLFGNIAAGNAVDAKSVDRLVAQLFQIFRNERNSIENLILGANSKGSQMAKASVDSAILSVFIAQELKFPTWKIVRIAAAALLHDAGMLRLPKELTEKRGGLSAAELQTMQSHPVYTYQILTEEMHCPEDIGKIAQQHHENWNGKGYPGGIAGNAIDPGARILSVVDAFEAMISKKSYRNSMVGYEAMRNLLSDNQSRFDPVVLKAFVRIMGIYPIGSVVLLNDRSIGKVTEIRSDTPLRPKILILQDKEGNRGKDGEVLDLMAEKALFITRALNPKEYPKERA